VPPNGLPINTSLDKSTADRAWEWKSSCKLFNSTSSSGSSQLSPYALW